MDDKSQKQNYKPNKSWLALIGWIAVTPTLGLIIGGVEGAIGISQAFLAIAAIWAFWIGGHAISMRMAKKFNAEEQFKIAYFVALAIFIFILVGWLGSDGSVCPPGAYGDMICDR